MWSLLPNTSLGECENQNHLADCKSTIRDSVIKTKALRRSQSSEFFHVLVKTTRLTIHYVFFNSHALEVMGNQDV